jgi:hypothetical protein
MDVTLGHRTNIGAPLSLSESERRRHIYLAGKTGTGKSTLLLNLMLQDLAAGRGFALIDPHGDLAQTVADCIPPERIADTIYVDPLDETHAVGFNPLQRVPESARPLAAEHFVSTLKAIYPDSWGPNLDDILYNAVRLLLDAPGSTLLGIRHLLINRNYRAKLLRYCADREIRAFWEGYWEGKAPKQQAEEMRSTLNKVGRFNADPVLRAMLGQSRSTIDIPAIMNSGKVLIVNLSKGRLGDKPAQLIGASLVSAFAQAAETRTTIPESERRDFTLYVDEFQNYASLSFGTILSEARKWRLNLVLANQFLAQQPLRDAVLGNIGTLVVFRVGSSDATILARRVWHRQRCGAHRHAEFQRVGQAAPRWGADRGHTDSHVAVGGYRRPSLGRHQPNAREIRPAKGKGGAGDSRPPPPLTRQLIACAIGPTHNILGEGSIWTTSVVSLRASSYSRS